MHDFARKWNTLLIRFSAFHIDKMLQVMHVTLKDTYYNLCNVICIFFTYIFAGSIIVHTCFPVFIFRSHLCVVFNKPIRSTIIFDNMYLNRNSRRTFFFKTFVFFTSCEYRILISTVSCKHILMRGVSYDSTKSNTVWCLRELSRRRYSLRTFKSEDAHNLILSNKIRRGGMNDISSTLPN